MRYLVLIGHVDILPSLFENVIVPPAVLTELSREQTPQTVRDWIKSPPAWPQIRTPMQEHRQLELGLGEREAIGPARELGGAIAD
jgi:predicted nucleic acid-binding protein